MTRRALAAAALTVACRRPPLPGDDAGARTIDRTVPNDASSQPPWARPARHRPDAAVDARSYGLDGRVTEAREGITPAGIVRMVRTRTGAAMVWPVASAAGTDVVALALDADGNATGVPRVLRAVPGRVEALDADARHGLLWVAFSTSMGTLGRWNLRRTGAVVATDDLAVARGPVIFEDLRVWPIQRRWRGVFAEVRAGDDGTAAALVSSDNTACPAGVPVAGRVNWVDCPGWKWFRVSQRPGMLADGRGGVVRPEPPPGALTRVPQGWTYAHGPVEALAEQMRVVFDPIPGGPRQRVLPAFTETVSFCERPRVAWTGDTWVATCAPVASLHEPDGALWVRAVRADGTAVTPARATTARLTGEVLRCFRGRPVVELRWEGGVVRIDPAHPDASLRLEQWNAGGVFDGVDAAVWAGRALVGVSAGTGRLRRWRCNEAGEVVGG
ncbi:MAG: hypothetical protein U0324_02515 [Polyangiales bacterium]